MIWYELQTNPIAAQALTEALARPRSERLSALGQAFADDPGHAGTAMAWLITAHEAGVWQRPRLLPGKKRLIPTKVVQFWDTAELPSDILACMQSWPQVCKGVEHQVFNAASARAFLRRECSAAVVDAFQVAGHPAMQADLFRLAYLSVHGGVYADADDRCRHAITDWLEPGCELLLLQEDHGSLGNNFLAAAPRHPFICALLERVTQNILARQGDNIWFISGPGAITVAFCEHYAQALSQGELPEGVKVLDMYQVYARVSMHLPRAYKQDDRHWASRKAASRPLFNHMVKLNRR